MRRHHQKFMLSISIVIAIETVFESILKDQIEYIIQRNESSAC
jgi:hypothetical protein